MTQTQAILEALESGRELTPLDALHDFRCFRLAARIGELKAQGHPIQTELRKLAGKHVATYRLGPRQERLPL